MKKLLVLFLSAVMVLSFAAVSMAATVEADWRAEWIQDGSQADPNDALQFKAHDLRLNFKGKVSDTVDAYMQYTFGTATALKEYYVTFNQSWGKVMAGQWDYKLVPSRVLLKPHGNLNCVNAKGSGSVYSKTNTKIGDMQLLFDVPVNDAFTFGFWMVPDLTEDEMSYDFKFAYKADQWGAEVHYGELDPALDEATYVSFDVYYDITDDIKVFLYGVDADDNIVGWEDNLAPVIGATFKNIAGSKLTASLEYALEETAVDYTEYALQFKYAFNNKVALEVEYQTVDKDDNKLIIRPRVKF
jgi:hypothetical protein